MFILSHLKWMLTKPPKKKQRTENATVSGDTDGRRKSALRAKVCRMMNLMTLPQTMSHFSAFCPTLGSSVLVTVKDMLKNFSSLAGIKI